jgi:hypothetical protein
MYNTIAQFRDYAVIELAADTGLGWMSFGHNSGLSSAWNLNLNGS